MLYIVAHQVELSQQIAPTALHGSSQCESVCKWVNESVLEVS